MLRRSVPSHDGSEAWRVRTAHVNGAYPIASAFEGSVGRCTPHLYRTLTNSLSVRGLRRQARPHGRCRRLITCRGNSVACGRRHTLAGRGTAVARVRAVTIETPQQAPHLLDNHDPWGLEHDGTPARRALRQYPAREPRPVKAAPKPPTAVTTPPLRAAVPAPAAVPATAPRALPAEPAAARPAPRISAVLTALALSGGLV